ncbi:MAG: hypothetical protein J7J93_02380 [Candidatus Aenigmarchaeota archaeon]|nr:hypothetical protein [Candidatus Aenigmarchaeota archaeon]
MKKGISGHTLVIIISLIVAIIGLTLLWIFLSQTEKEGESFAAKLIESIKDLVPRPVKWILPGI